TMSGIKSIMENVYPLLSPHEKSGLGIYQVLVSCFTPSTEAILQCTAIYSVITGKVPYSAQ
ncbi:hypothetical protein, partial [Priestia megaterium]|uniref:hypothetical protein n=1 Tax=Priestia megaterium TaxID=1404 RepID=UPI0035B611CF